MQTDIRFLNRTSKLIINKPIMINEIIYDDDIIAVRISSQADRDDILQISLRYCAPKDVKDKNGEVIGHLMNRMGGETDWFILPHTFGAEIGRKLFEQYNAGLDGFNKNAVLILKQWLIDMEVIHVAMCY